MPARTKTNTTAKPSKFCPVSEENCVWRDDGVAFLDIVEIEAGTLVTTGGVVMTLLRRI